MFDLSAAQYYHIAHDIEPILYNAYVGLLCDPRFHTDLVFDCRNSEPWNDPNTSYGSVFYSNQAVISLKGFSMRNNITRTVYCKYKRHASLAAAYISTFFGLRV